MFRSSHLLRVWVVIHYQTNDNQCLTINPLSCVTMIGFDFNAFLTLFEYDTEPVALIDLNTFILDSF